MTTKTVTSSADGTIPGLRVVGYHGRLGSSQTPARRAPVYAADDGRPVRIRGSEPGPDEGYSLKLEYGERPIPDDVWATTGTRIEPPWPATLAAPLMLILGERELRVVHELLRYDGHDPEQAGVTRFLRWVETETPRSDTLRCVRVGELLAWNCTRALADALCARVAIVARRQVMDAAHEHQRLELRRASFWLSRAKVRDEDVFLAAAGLRRAGFEQWEDLLHAGVQSGTTAQRLAAVDGAAAMLSSGSLREARARERFSCVQKAVRCSQDDLVAANVRAVESRQRMKAA